PAIPRRGFAWRRLCGCACQPRRTLREALRSFSRAAWVAGASLSEAASFFARNREISDSQSLAAGRNANIRSKKEQELPKRRESRLSKKPAKCFSCAGLKSICETGLQLEKVYDRT